MKVQLNCGVQSRRRYQQASRAEQDYLKTLHRLGGCRETVSPIDIADHLKVRPPSVTSMLKRLDDAGWIHYQPGIGARLTTKGIHAARQVIRRHRLVELFLARILGYDWSEVDAEAEALEHAISSRLEKAISDHLGDPQEDPHGHPIPTAQGALGERPLQPLCAFCPGQQVIIREAEDDDPERLRRWHALGLLPGVIVRILFYQPLDDLFHLQIGSSVLPMGSEGLAGLHGEELVG